MSTNPIIELISVSKRYGDITAVDDLSLSLNAGEVTAMLGPNGAGKTSSVHLMMGLLKPSAGAISVLGHPPGERVARQRCGAMLQISGLPDTLKVKELLHLFESYYPKNLGRDAVVDMSGIASLLDRRFGNLSGGEKQRIMFALSICGDPELLFLDEPTVGMDVTSRHRFWHAVRELSSSGKAVVLTTHYLEEADALADRVVVINHGQLVADGSPEEIKSAVPSGRVRCRTTLEKSAVLTMAGVGHADREGGLLTVATSEPEALVRQLLAADQGLTELEVSKADLAQAFLHLTGDTTDARGAAS
ncbi:MAG: ABC transporter ATP-binding protein [Lysobacterales bacterium]